MKTFVIIGLGRFGTSVALELSALGHEVLAMDLAEDKVQRVADKVTHAVVADARDINVLNALGVRNFDCAVVAMGSDVGNSALVTLNLKELGLQQVVCKAQSHVHQRVLEKIGADRVIFPEHEMGVKLAQGLSSSSVLNFIEFSEDYGIVELAIPRSWQGKTIRELDVRNAYHV
ncbi:MAG: TrkA family potassium uptake protein, partial [Oscillospiraceae bacterium]|nr:TrkA family potassium uptake protein [Oscillospiraceae bacterium]